MAAPFDTVRPHPARVYDYMLGGKDTFAPDRAVWAEEAPCPSPSSLAQAARLSRQCSCRPR